ncbi:4-aminobutyrate--2-oxoglutarate transaminase [Legionella anisa]|uniref:4-aminobutyrate--2-oxoglutarate transaminase n=1 Tax=Legionella anisa TaxID=28082 RepID=A0AAX0WPR6_9GAMM|nr:4-aminobutyrate--2-oxoglutarate transaminase [Legionella anisa]AWN73146.1 4-aminobutyrate--2-oxoglutarate transaminase [Legionella anisa]KTC67419.1 4-aminobutyrate aminotransferase [Legionella anisa]MCW8423976.1 4-aminobutyrate--2-oxoglutarate transaminase [Legionella anisa]MCW8447498.1 4-aminobutyrate--2-oxoglutarate transaminase [Legionella anisa]PNL60264.1 4-aminobutyrate--2-oxoglutarate transaminase [Legionella anisa]
MNQINIKTQIPGPKSKKLMERRYKHVARGPFHATPIFVERAKGSFIEDVDGNVFLDFSSGIGVVNTGHCPDAIVNAVKAQAEKFMHTSFNILPYEGYINVCEKLNYHTPGHFEKKSILLNSGAEAVENAIKIARAYTGKQAVICFDHAYHGRTYMAMSLTAKNKPYKHGFGPFLSEIHRAPIPYEYRWQGKNCVEECFNDFSELVNFRVGVENTAAVILEPVLGEGGFIQFPAPFLQKLREFCTVNKIVFIADEIQSGFGRTGNLFAMKTMGVDPDLTVSAKGLGGGTVIAAVTGKAEMMDAAMVGGLGGTFGGNPLSCAAALEVFKIFEEEGLLNHVTNLAKVLHSKLSGFKEKYKIVGDFRGLGVMQAIELVEDKNTKEPNKVAADRLTKFCLEHGLVILSCGGYGNVIRLLMPLSTDVKDLEIGLSIIEEGLKTL